MYVEQTATGRNSAEPNCSLYTFFKKRKALIIHRCRRIKARRVGLGVVPKFTYRKPSISLSVSELFFFVTKTPFVSIAFLRTFLGIPGSPWHRQVSPCESSVLAGDTGVPRTERALRRRRCSGSPSWSSPSPPTASRRRQILNYILKWIWIEPFATISFCGFFMEFKMHKGGKKENRVHTDYL